MPPWIWSKQLYSNVSYQFPCRNGLNEPVSLWMSLRGKRDMSTRERSTAKQEEHSFPPQGIVLASILSSPIYWFDSQSQSSKTMLRIMDERKLHKVLCQIYLLEYNFWITFSTFLLPKLSLFLFSWRRSSTGGFLQHYN